MVYQSECEFAVFTGNCVFANTYSGYTGLGYATGFTSDGSSATIYMDIPANGYYNIITGYSNSSVSDKFLSLYVDSTFAKQITFKATAGWTTWAKQLTPVFLTSGIHALKFEKTSSDSGDVVYTIRLIGDGKMAKAANINMRIDPEFKEKVENLFSELGLSTTEAINIFLHQAVLQGGLPFEVKNHKKVNYFADLHQSIEQLEQGKIVIKTIDELGEMEN